MANHILNNQKRNRSFARRERALEGAIKHNDSPEHLAALAEKVRQSKLQAFRALASAGTVRGQAASQRTVEKSLAMTQEEIVEMYRRKCEQARAETTSEHALDPDPEAPDA